MYIIFYNKFFVPKGSAGCVRLLFIFIDPKYKDDIGLLEHEKTHVRQSLKGLIFPHVFLYKFYRKYRLNCEVEAYKVQIREYNVKDFMRHSEYFANVIATKYGLDITKEEALKLLL